ncbi:MAG: hypothetical protein RL757_2115, partial [Bacteroidota bacterium]
MNKILKHLLVVCGVFCCISTALGSHIVGGYISQKFISRSLNVNTYDISVRLYRDCGRTSSAFNPIIELSIYEGNDIAPVVTRVCNLGVESIRTVSPPSYPCLTVPSYVCVQQADYYSDVRSQQTLISLPLSNRTYRIVARICCRNALISNILYPSIAGATYYLEITPEGQIANNSSPDFNLFPPTVICQNEALNFDHSANDSNEDNLVYEFCDSPNTGSGPGCSLSLSACNAPFTSVTYKPGFTGSNPFGANALPAMRINSQTGFITGTPLVQGNYVVGVCVKEYRNGILMGTIFRDFQFNVEPCRKSISARIGANLVGANQYFFNNCDNLNITLANTSTPLANISSTLWRFNVNGTVRETNGFDFNFRFSDTGTYRGVMYLNPNTPCGDSALITIRLGPVGVNANATFQYDSCKAGPVAFRNTSALTRDITKFIWNYGDGTRPDTNVLNPSHLFQTPGNKRVTLSLLDRLGCKEDTTLIFGWNPAPAILIIEPDRYLSCAPLNVKFKNRSIPVDSTYKVTWNLGDGTIVRTIDAEHTYPNPGKYTVSVRIVSPIGCTKSATYDDWVQVNPNPKAGFDFSPKNATNIESRVSFLDTSSSDATSWRWFFPRGYGFSTDKNPSVFFNRDTGWLSVRLRVSNKFGCSDSASAKVYIRPEVRFFMPNAFSPNADSNNEVFKGTGFTFGMKSFNMKVFSKWGESVFETNDIEEGWNGQKRNIGESMPQGTYLYTLKYVTPLNEIVEKRGYVTL